MTRCIEQTLRVQSRYPVYLSDDTLAPDHPLLAELVGRRRLVCVVDAGVARHYPRLLIEIARYAEARALDFDACASLLIEPEAAAREGHAAWSIYAALHAPAPTPTAILAIGGGRLLDYAGWAVAHARGRVRCIRLPTTAVAQCEAALRLHAQTQNPPPDRTIYAPLNATVNDGRYLQALTTPAWIAGCVRALELGLLHDRTLFEFIDDAALRLRERDMASLRVVLARAATLPLPAGAARDVEPGPWASRIAERITGRGLRRSEVHAHGLALGAAYAVAAGLLDEAVWHRALHALGRLGLPPLAALRDRRLAWLPDTTLADREPLATLLVPTGIGTHRRVTIDPPLWRAAWRLLANDDAANRIRAQRQIRSSSRRYA